MNYSEILNMCPGLPGTNTRPLTPVEDWSKVGATNNALYKEGDVIKFIPSPDGTDKPFIVSQQLRMGSDIKVYYLLVELNDNLAWFALGNLTRVDKDMKPVDAFREEMRAYPDLGSRWPKLKNTSIKCTGVQDFQFNHFEDNVRVEGKYDTRKVSLFVRI